MAALQSISGALATLPDTAATSPATTCPFSSATTDIQALLSVPPRTPLTIPCKFLSARVTDPQGRKPGPDNTLYVVPETAYSVKVGKASTFGAAFSRSFSADSETISANASLAGGCGKHLAWEIGTAAGGSTKIGSAAELEAAIIRPKGPVLPIAFPFSVSRLAVLACEGGGKEYTIYSVAGDEVEFEFDTDKVATPFKTSMSRAFKLDTNKVERESKKATSGKLKVSQAWEEDKKSHRAYCKTKFDVSVDPLLKLSGKFLVYGVPVPRPVDKYLKAGIFITLEFNAKLTSDLVLKLWADDREWQWESGSLLGKAKATVALGVELTLLDPDVCGLEVSGQTGLDASLGLDSKASGVRLSGKWLGLTAKVTVSLMDGFIEVSKDWKWLDDTEPLKHDWPIESLFGPPPAADGKTS